MLKQRKMKSNTIIQVYNSGRYLAKAALLCLMLTSGFVFSQNDKEIEILPDDTVKVNRFIEKGKNFCAKDNQKALYYLQEALFLSNNLDYLEGIAYSYLWIGRVYYYKDEYELAENNLNKAMHLFEDLNDYYGMAYVYFAFASISDLMGDYVNAMEQNQKVIEYAKLANNEKLMAIGIFGIGATHLDRNEINEGLAYFSEALAIRKNLGDSAGIANIYNLMASAYEKQQVYDSALLYFKKGLAIRESLGDIRAIANSTYPQGILYIELGKYDKAIANLERAKSIYIQLKEQTGLCIANTYLALALKYSGKNSEAKALIQQSLRDAKRFNNPTLIADCYKVMARMAATDKNYRKAYELSLKMKALSDSMARVNKEIIIQDLEARYQLKNKNSQIELLESQAGNQRKNILILSISIAGLTFIILLIIILFRLKAKSQRRQFKVVEQEKTILEQDERIKEKEMQLLHESVESKNRNLAAKAIEMLRINETIGEVINKLEQMKNLNLPDQKFSKHIKEIARELENQTNTNTWKEFDKIFKNIHNEFYDHLLIICPTLTASEIKIAALLKLNLSTKEIAAITYKTEDGIKSTRYRLRKKLNLSGDENLIPFLMKL